MKDPDITGSLMKEKVKETKKSTAMTDRKIVELSVTDTIRAKVIEKEWLLRTLMKEEDIDRGEMSPAEEYTEITQETSPEIHQERDQEGKSTETNQGTALETDIDKEDTLKEAVAKTVEKETTEKKTGSPTMVKGDSERVARSP